MVVFTNCVLTFKSSQTINPEVGMCRIKLRSKRLFKCNRPELLEIVQLVTESTNSDGTVN